MEIIIQPTAADVHALAAEHFRRLLSTKPDGVLGLATGSTPVGVYARLVELHRRGRMDFSRVTTFNLDEYLGIGPEHPGSYRRFMQEQLFDHVNIIPAHTHLPDGLAADIPAECAVYEEAIRLAGGIDLQLLGIGLNGHIGFNEPGSALDSRTRRERLAPDTIAVNARHFAGADAVPRHCITMGVGTIMESRTCLLLATGAAKAEIVARFITGPVTPEVPASVLQRHPHCVVLLDEAAAARLPSGVAA